MDKRRTALITILFAVFFVFVGLMGLVAARRGNSEKAAEAYNRGILVVVSTTAEEGDWEHRGGPMANAEPWKHLYCETTVSVVRYGDGKRLYFRIVGPDSHEVEKRVVDPMGMKVYFHKTDMPGEEDGRYRLYTISFPDGWEATGREVYF